jgi:hypothetical protein
MSHLRLPLVATVLTLALAAPANALIVPQKGIHGASIGMSVTQVRAKLGKPDAVSFPKNEIIGRVRQYRYDRTLVIFDGDGKDAKVINLTTDGRGERTSAGIGVGSLRADVAKKVPGVKCRVEDGLDHCYIGKFQAGKRITDFRMATNGRVNQVIVGIVVD